MHVGVARLRCPIAEVLEQLRRRRWGDHGGAGMHCPDRSEQELGFGILNTNPLAPARIAFAAFSSRSKVVSTRMRGGVFAVAVSAANPLGGLDAVSHRHPDVHQHHVGLRREHDVPGLDAVARFPDDFEVVLRVDQHPQAAAEQLPGRRRARHGRRRAHPDTGAASVRVNGIVARTRNRPFVPSLASSSPPASVARSRIARDAVPHRVGRNRRALRQGVGHDDGQALRSPVEHQLRRAASGLRVAGRSSAPLERCGTPRAPGHPLVRLPAHSCSTRPSDPSRESRARGSRGRSSRAEAPPPGCGAVRRAAPARPSARRGRSAAMFSSASTTGAGTDFAE